MFLHVSDLFNILRDINGNKWWYYRSLFWFILCRGLLVHSLYTYTEYNSIQFNPALNWGQSSLPSMPYWHRWTSSDKPYIENPCIRRLHEISCSSRKNSLFIPSMHLSWNHISHELQDTPAVTSPWHFSQGYRIFLFAFAFSVAVGVPAAAVAPAVAVGPAANVGSSPGAESISARSSAGFFIAFLVPDISWKV